MYINRKRIIIVQHFLAILKKKKTKMESTTVNGQKFIIN